jgi:hypothetical protein
MPVELVKKTLTGSSAIAKGAFVVASTVGFAQPSSPQRTTVPSPVFVQ